MNGQDVAKPDLTKWLSLWERCPELEVPHCDDPGCTMRMRFVRAADGEDPADLIAWMNETEFAVCGGVVRRGQHQQESDFIASALIRDRAVIVGGEKWGLVLEFLANEWAVSRRGNVGATPYRSTIASSPDPAEALRLACAKVLGVEA